MATLFATAVALTLGGAAAQAPGALAAAHTQRCNTFRGKRLLHNRSVTVFERFEEAHRGYAYVCVPPRGRLYLVGNAYDELRGGLFSVKVLATAGTWVALKFESIQDPHDEELVDKTCDARNGHCYYFYRLSINHVLEYTPGPPAAGQPEQGALETLALNGFGEMLLGEQATSTTKVIGVGSSGAQTVLDSAAHAQIPLSSLKLVGHVAEWTDGGVAHTATL
jgi:hypothetical protein